MFIYYYHVELSENTFWACTTQLYERSEIYYRLIWIILSFLWIGKWINLHGTNVAQQHGRRSKKTEWNNISGPLALLKFFYCVICSNFPKTISIRSRNLLNLLHPHFLLSFVPLPCTFWLRWLNNMNEHWIILPNLALFEGTVVVDNFEPFLTLEKKELVSGEYGDCT